MRNLAAKVLSDLNDLSMEIVIKGDALREKFGEYFLNSSVVLISSKVTMSFEHPACVGVNDKARFLACVKKNRIGRLLPNSVDFEKFQA